MYISRVYLAHTGVALGAKGANQRLPLAWCLTAAWAYDLTGIGHWAPFSVLIAGFAFWLGRRRWGAAAGAVLAATVLSHDILDLVVGLQILPGGAYIGANLDTSSVLEYGLEVAVIVGGWLLYRATLPDDARARPETYLPVALLVLASTAAFWLTEPAVVDNHSPDPVRMALLAIGIAATWTAIIWADRRATPSAAGHPRPQRHR